MREIDLLVFDLDGTLVDTRKDIVNAANFMLTSLNFDAMPGEKIISYVGRGIREFIGNFFSDNSNGLKDEAFRIFKAYYKEHPADNSFLYTGVHETLEYFKCKEKAVVTNRGHGSSEDILKKMNIDCYFNHIIGDDNTNCLKPSRCQFDRLFQKSFAKDRKKAIMIGDMDIDILAGRASEIWTCAVTYGLGSRYDIEKSSPDYIIDDICELKNIIR
jgi:phosphoglycolate phosphatase